MAIRRSAALSLAQWIQQEHPGLYQHLLRRAPVSGLGRLGDAIPIDPTVASDVTVDYVANSGVYDPQSLREASFQQSATLPGPISDPAMNPVSVLDATALTPFDVNADLTIPGTATIESPPTPAVSASNNTIASVWGSTVQGLSALANVAASYFKSQQTPSNAALQSSVLQAQLARVAAGGNPAALSYVRNPVTGALVPTVQTYNGTMPLSQQGLASLVPAQFSSLFSGSMGLYILLGGAALLLVALARR